MGSAFLESACSAMGAGVGLCLAGGKDTFFIILTKNYIVWASTALHRD